MLHVDCAVIIRENALLIVRKENFWILPGGKIEKGETDAQCLSREICDEEIPTLMIKNLRYFRKFFGITPISKKPLCAKVYFAESEGKLSVGKDDSISEAVFSKHPFRFNLSDVTKDIVVSLYKQGLL